jgi:hypothetical protein
MEHWVRLWFLSIHALWVLILVKTSCRRGCGSISCWRIRTAESFGRTSEGRCYIATMTRSSFGGNSTSRAVRQRLSTLRPSIPSGCSSLSNGFPAAFRRPLALLCYRFRINNNGSAQALIRLAWPVFPETEIRESGLWLVNELYKEPLTPREAEELARAL